MLEDVRVRCRNCGKEWEGAGNPTSCRGRVLLLLEALAGAVGPILMRRWFVDKRGALFSCAKYVNQGEEIIGKVIGEIEPLQENRLG